MNTICRKYLYLNVVFLFLCLSVHAQQYARLKAYDTDEGVPSGKAVIYGTFIQRLGFSSGGFAQYISVMNVETRKAYSFRVKPTFKSARQNVFCYALPPGTYAILSYEWTESKWYGGMMNIEPVFKALPPEDKALENTAKARISFKVEANTLNYVGTWHFDKSPASFTDDGKELTPKLRKRYSQFDFSKAFTLLPQ